MLDYTIYKGEFVYLLLRQRVNYRLFEEIVNFHEHILPVNMAENKKTEKTEKTDAKKGTETDNGKKKDDKKEQDLVIRNYLYLIHKRTVLAIV